MKLIYKMRWMDRWMEMDEMDGWMEMDGNGFLGWISLKGLDWFGLCLDWIGLLCSTLPSDSLSFYILRGGRGGGPKDELLIRR